MTSLFDRNFPLSIDIGYDDGGARVQITDLVLTNPSDSLGCCWEVDELTGWDSSPGSNRQQTAKTRGAGSWSGPRNLNSRVITVSGYIYAPTVDALQAAIAQLHRNVTLADTQLSVQRGSQVLTAIVARQDEVTVTEVTDLVVQFSFQVGTDDPLKYGQQLVASGYYPATSGGLAVPLTVPVTMAATTTSGVLSLDNPGNAVGPVRIIFNGPVVNPQVTHVDQAGRSSTIALNYTVRADEYLLLDPTNDGQSVLSMGQASRANALRVAQWHGFIPDSNTWYFAAGSPTSAIVQVEAIEAWQ